MTEHNDESDGAVRRLLVPEVTSADIDAVWNRAAIEGREYEDAHTYG